MFNKPNEFRRLKFKTITKIICVCVFTAFFIAILPAIGWSYYANGSENLACNIEWSDPSLSVRSYIVFIVTVLFIFPLSLISITSVKSYNSVIDFDLNFKIILFDSC